MDSKWAQKRRTRLNLIATIVAFVGLSIYLGIRMYTPPTCFDHKRNQDEVGKDCGGVCDLYCASQIQSLTTSWARAFEVSPGWYNAVAYIQNPNFLAYTEKAEYKFQLYDRNGSLLEEVTGETFLNGEAGMPIFAGRIQVSAGEPYRTVFEWVGQPAWVKKTQNRQLSVEEQVHVPSATTQEVRAVLNNKEPFELKDVKVVAVVYDRAENAIAASETYVDFIGPRSKKRIVFSWPQPFTAAVGRIELVPRIPLQN